jgi:hypothetical protein
MMVNDVSQNVPMGSEQRPRLAVFNIRRGFRTQLYRTCSLSSYGIEASVLANNMQLDGLAKTGIVSTSQLVILIPRNQANQCLWRSAKVRVVQHVASSIGLFNTFTKLDIFVWGSYICNEDIGSVGTLSKPGRSQTHYMSQEGGQLLK